MICPFSVLISDGLLHEHCSRISFNVSCSISCLLAHVTQVVACLFQKEDAYVSETVLLVPLIVLEKDCWLGLPNFKF